MHLNTLIKLTKVPLKRPKSRHYDTIPTEYNKGANLLIN
jgi:hypothetical protein